MEEAKSLKDYWRIIKHYTNCSDELMKDLAKNKKDVKEIASNLDVIFKRFPKGTRQSNNYIKKWVDTPLHSAADTGALNSYHLIMENVADKNPLNPNWYPTEKGLIYSGTTPLHLAAIHDDFDLFKLIFDNVDDKNPKDEKKNTPFHFAAGNGNLEICQLIIERLEDKNPSGGTGNHFGCCFGSTPRHVAAANGHLDVCKLITEAVGIEEQKIYPTPFYPTLTPLDLAIQYKHVHVQKYLQNLQRDLRTKRRKMTEDDIEDDC